MKILFCGLGSIGQRHLRLLKKIFADKAEKAEFLAYRTRCLQQVITDELTILPDRRVDEFYNIKVFDDYDVALAQKPDIVFVTNPIALHVETAMKAISANAHVFIEKPLSHHNENLMPLYQLAVARKKIVYVGYQFRFHPLVQMLKSVLDSQPLGPMIYADLFWGEHLPHMHRYEDYRDSHMSQDQQGGGVINCMSHEVDYLRYLFGEPQSSYVVGGHLSSLQLSVEDVIKTIFTFQRNAARFYVTLSLDFITKPTRRGGFICCDAGHISWDLTKQSIEIDNYKTEQRAHYSYPNFQRNQLFIDELNDFLKMVEQAKQTKQTDQFELCSLNEAIQTQNLLAQLTTALYQHRELSHV